MANDEDDPGGTLSRRALLERASVLVGLSVVVPACGVGGDDDGEHLDPRANAGDGGAGSTTGGDGDGGQTSAAGSGSGSGDGNGNDNDNDNGASERPARDGGGASEQPAGDGDGDGASEHADGGAARPGDMTSSGSPVVAIVKQGDIDQAVARAVELAGGLAAIEPGHTVFIKPNAVSDRALGTPGIRTSNEVLAAVVRLVKTRNPGRIVVGDRSARGFDVANVFDATGMAEAAMAAGADEIYMPFSAAQDPDAWVLLQPPEYEESWGAAGGIYAMRRIVEADHLINVPTCKDHRYAVFSLAMKNFIGAIDDSSRGPLHYASSIAEDFTPLGHDIARINQMFEPLMTIIDATTVLVNGGPEGDGDDAVRAQSGLILASRDRVALDAAGVSLIQYEQSRATISQPDRVQSTLQNTRPWALPQIAYAATLGLGVGAPDQAELVLDGLGTADAGAIRERFESR